MGSISVSLDEADEGFEIHAIIASPTVRKAGLSCSHQNQAITRGIFN